MRTYEVGERIGGEYEVLDIYGGEGRSGMGVVYLVCARDAPKPFVMKTYQRALEPADKKTFIAEARAWINAGAHPHIVQAIFVQEIEGQLFVAAEFVAPDDEGRNSITHYLSDRPIRDEIVLTWAAQFCYGMDYARSKGVLAHRDIKPDNLMVDGSCGLRVTDFGLARAVEHQATGERKWWHLGKKKEATPITHDKTGAMGGTLIYMAPEQAFDYKHADHRADIYSFGIVLYQLVSGSRYPYRIDWQSPDVESEVLKAHATQAPQAVASPLMPVIARCLEKRADRRFATYDALLAAVSAVAKQVGVRLPAFRHEDRDDEELYAKAQSYVALGDAERALSCIDEYTKRFGDRACGWTEKGKLHYQRGEYGAGVRATQRSIALEPYNTRSWNNLGVGLGRTGAPKDQVRKAYKLALQLDEGNTSAMINLAGFLATAGELDEAGGLTLRALRRRPDKDTTVNNAKFVMQRLFEAQALPAARALLEGWCEVRPTDAFAWHNLGLLGQAAQEHSAALRCFENVRQLDPDDMFAVEQLAKLSFQVGQLDRCLGYCDLLLERRHNPTLGMSLKARALSHTRGYAAALAFIKPWIDAAPKNDTLLVTLADVAETHGHVAQAVAALEAAAALVRSLGGVNADENLSYLHEKLARLRQE